MIYMFIYILTSSQSKFQARAAAAAAVDLAADACETTDPAIKTDIQHCFFGMGKEHVTHKHDERLVSLFISVFIVLARI